MKLHNALPNNNKKRVFYAALILATALLLIFIFSSPLASQEADKIVTKTGVIDDDYYAAGATVDIDAIVQGDVIVSGGTVTVKGQVNGDAMASGGKVNLHGEIQDDVRAAGGTINVTATIGDDLLAAGGSLYIASNTTVGGDAWLAGGDVKMAGTIAKDLFIGAGNIQLSGLISGDVTLKGETIRILEGTKIDGSLNYTSPSEADIDAGAVINGEIHHQPYERVSHPVKFGVMFALTLTVAGSVLLFLFPNFTISSFSKITGSPLKSLALGFVLLFILPIFAVLLISTMVGVWVGLAILALYFVSLLVGFLLGCFYVGDKGAGLIGWDISTKTRRIVSLVIALLALAIITMIPFVGGWAMFLVLLLGLGAGILQIYHHYRRSELAS